MPPKSLSAKSKASVALSGYFDFLKWEVGRKRLGRKRHNPFRGANVLASTTEWTIPVTLDPAEGSSITLLKNWERLHCIASLKFVVSNFCIEAYQPRLKRHTETKKAAAGWDWRRLSCEFLTQKDPSHAALVRLIFGD